MTHSPAVALDAPPSPSTPSDIPCAPPQVSDTADTPAPWLSIVLPAHNEADNIEAVIDDFAQAAARLARPVELLVINDCSRDATGALAAARADAMPPSVTLRVITRTAQGGYGRALTTGFEAARGQWVFFSDADGQFDALQLPGFLASVADDDDAPIDAVVGFRAPRCDPPGRRALGWTWTRIVRSAFGINVRDINCAFKAVRGHHLRAMRLHSRGALINAEMLHKARRMRLRIEQRPVAHRPRQAGEQTGANPAVIARALSELLRYRLATLGGREVIARP